MTDVSTTRRKAMSPTRRLRIFEAHGGKCALCGGKIDGVREPWIVEHLRALGLGGPDTDDNCGPAHAYCADAKTHQQDMPAIAKAKRRKMKALGIRKPSTFSTSRDSRFKSKIGGGVVYRETGEPVR